jgi:hypothetical protein
MTTLTLPRLGPPMNRTVAPQHNASRLDRKSRSYNNPRQLVVHVDLREPYEVRWTGPGRMEMVNGKLVYIG